MIVAKRVILCQTQFGKPSGKKYGIFWEFLPNVGPPKPQPPLVKKNKNELVDFVKILVCFLGDFRVI